MVARYVEADDANIRLARDGVPTNANNISRYQSLNLSGTPYPEER